MVTIFYKESHLVFESAQQNKTYLQLINEHNSVSSSFSQCFLGIISVASGFNLSKYLFFLPPPEELLSRDFLSFYRFETEIFWH